MNREVDRVVSRPRFTVRSITAACREFQPHAHAAYTVTTVLAGSVAISIGQHEAELSAGQTALTNVGQTHAARAVDFELLSVAVDPVLVDELLTEAGLHQDGLDVVFRASVVTDPTIAAIAARLADELGREQLGQAPMLDALVRQLVVHLLRSHLTVRRSAVTELSRAGPVDRRLRRPIEFMYDHYARDLTLEEIASAAYLSAYHFARLFKEITGMTPHSYLANLRIERARELLLTTDLSITEIAGRVGYRSQSHFAKVFKSVTGATPRSYRDSTVRAHAR